jgi:predicted ATPase
MNSLIIKNIGAIKHVDIELNQINVIMGPQSSGKSTIAKIISYCQWVEKRFLLDGKYHHKFSEQFMDFHRIDENYFSSESFFKYETDFVSISCKGLEKKEKIIKKEKSIEYKKSKNIYIPAERNFVSAIPNLGKFKESNDHIMSFLYDWYDTKKIYSKRRSLNILNLGINYHHIKKSDSDILTIEKNNKEISLQNASSGLQSLVPLTMLIDYLSTSFYKKKKTNSVNETDEIKSIIIKRLNEYVDNKENEHTYTKEDVTQLLHLVSRRTEYHFSSFIIEEPEQNLFPKTQRDLIYYLLEKVTKSKRKHTLTLTTHSPFILNALNNCMLGFLVKDELEKEVKDDLLSNKSWVNPDLVSVYEIKDGEIKSIKNEQTGTISKHYFNEVMNEVMDEYYEMLNYLEL